MSYISKTTRVIPNYTTQRKVESTLAHVTRAWFPCDPEQLHLISENIQSGFYEENRRALLEHVKGDLALLTHTAKCVRARLEEPVAVVNPLRDLLFLPNEDLEQIFSVETFQVSKHRLGSCGKVRAQILEVAMRAAHTTEAFAHEANATGTSIDTDTAFSSAALQQIGWNLLGWNYPDLTSRTLRASGRDRALAAAQLQAVLGLSPDQLSAKFADVWLFEPALRNAFTGTNANFFAETPELKEQVRLLVSLKNAAECFAAIETGLASKQDELKWDQQQSRLKELIPGIEIEKVKSRANKSFEPFLDRLKFQISAKRMVLAPSTPENTAARNRDFRSMEANRHLQKCSKETQQLFAPVYAAIEEVGASIAAIENLVRDTLPNIGFTGGCIYMLDPLRANLVPAVKLGSSGVAKNPRFRSLLEASALESFGSSTPLRKQEITETGEVLEHVCAAFGDAKRPGVLLLEVGESTAELPSFDSTLLFRAIRQCLHQCLDMQPVNND